MKHRRLVVLRPEPGASASVARAAQGGLQALAYPLFTIRPVAWTPLDAAKFDAILFTSANAVRHGGEGLSRYRHLPVFAVGQATADAAVAAGFGHCVAGGTDVAAVLRCLAQAGHRNIFHPAGKDVRDVDTGALHVTRVMVYASDDSGDADGLAAVLHGECVVLVHSPRAGGRLAELVAPDVRPRHHVVAISPAAMAAAGTGWASVCAADRPDDTVLLALAAKLCQ